MLLRTQYCGLMMLQAHAERILNGQGKHPGTSEAWGDLPETTACRVERLLNTFVGTKKLWSLVTKIGSSEGFVDYFMKKLWPSKGNPFCSGMEADTSAFLKDYASYVF